MAARRSRSPAQGPSDWAEGMDRSRAGGAAQRGRRNRARDEQGSRKLRHARPRPTSERQDHVRRRLPRHAVESAPPASGNGDLTMATMNMIQALNSAMDVM